MLKMMSAKVVRLKWCLRSSRVGARGVVDTNVVCDGILFLAVIVLVLAALIVVAVGTVLAIETTAADTCCNSCCCADSAIEKNSSVSRCVK